MCFETFILFVRKRDERKKQTASSRGMMCRYINICILDDVYDVRMDERTCLILSDRMHLVPY